MKISVITENSRKVETRTLRDLFTGQIYNMDASILSQHIIYVSVYMDHLSN